MFGYRPIERAIFCRDGNRICNRPIFCANGPTSILVGDRPVIRLIRYHTLLGTFRAWVTLGEKRYYLDQFGSCEFTYRAGMCEWQLHDNEAHCALHLTLGAPEDTEGFVLKITADWPISLNWEFGGIHTFTNGSWNLNLIENPEIGSPEIDPEWLRQNQTQDLPGGAIRISMQEQAVTVRSSPSGILAHQHLQKVRGIVPVSQEPVTILVCRGAAASPEDAFESMLARSRRLGRVFRSDSPDPWLDAQMAVLAAEIDGAWYPPRTMHSNQLWNMPYLGWCNRFGNMLGGWTDRVRDELRYYVGKINREDVLHGGEPDHGCLDCMAGPSSRLYGYGHVNEDQMFYNMQSQFFDQAIFAWRMSGDPEIAELLHDALELHTRWQDECFDPDCDGLYESYINSWPTDSVWYSGGGSCEETCYAYRAHDAAYELCVAAGDEDAAAHHREVLERIARAFIDRLWLRDAGYPAMLREYFPPHRLHRSAWLYNCFLPVDCELVDRFEAVTCLDYSRWGLENVREPLGGRTVWLSNWVPAIWSVRRNEPGENFQLAYAYFKAGLADDGYELLSGALRRAGFGSNSPGHICSEAASLLARAVICGLHGYRPDYPNGRVLLSPAYPSDWRQASIVLPYFNCSYKLTDGGVFYRFAMEKAGRVTLRLPIRAKRIISVKGAESWSLEAGFGEQILVCELGECSRGEVEIEAEQFPCPVRPFEYSCAPCETARFDRFPVVRVYDPQQLLEEWQLSAEGTLTFTLRSDMDGEHTLFLLCRQGEAEFWATLHVHVSPTRERLALLERTSFRPEKPSFEAVPIIRAFNASAADIFRQKYLSPRPEGVNLSIGTDGYSPWTFNFWKNPLPEIRFESPLKTVRSRDGIPFLLGGADSNIAFTSRWDNWPDRIQAPVGRCADAIYCLVCGSTNPMQCGIANAVLRFRYSDGVCEELELTPPDNFWSMFAYTCSPSSAEQDTCNDYDYQSAGFCLPETPPDTIQLGQNCRAVAVGFRLRPDVTLESVELECLSTEVVIGLMAVTLCRDGSKEKDA